MNDHMLELRKRLGGQGHKKDRKYGPTPETLRRLQDLRTQVDDLRGGLAGGGIHHGGVPSGSASDHGGGGIASSVGGLRDREASNTAQSRKETGLKEKKKPRLVTNRYRPERERLCEAFIRGDLETMADAQRILRDMLAEVKPRTHTKKWGTRQ